MREQVDVRVTALAHVGQCSQANRSIRRIARHFVTVVALHHDHRILARQITGGKLVATVVAGNVAREVSVRLLQGATVAKLVQVNRRALQERPLLREACQRVERDCDPLGVQFQLIAASPQFNHHRRIATHDCYRGVRLVLHRAARTSLAILARLAVLAIFTVQHNADAIAVADDLQARAILEFFRLARKTGFIGHSRIPLAFGANAD